MQQRNQAFSIKGMQRDLSESVFNSEYAYENRNIRITPTDDNTGFALVNEKGTEKIVIEDLEGGFEGTPIGQCVINNQLVVFCTPGIIYIIYKEDGKYYGETLFNGELNFSDKHPIEAYPYYENEELQKIYWVDGINPFRFINVGKLKGERQNTPKELINAVPDLQLKESVEIVKNYDSGIFAPGIIQYCFTYIKKYAQESAIFYTSPLYYISYKDRGGNPEEKVTNSFNIKVDNVDHNFDYVRVYAMHRTSINAAMNTRRVADLLIENNHVSLIDTGTIGDSIPDTDLLFKTGEEIIPNTINSKNNTLFLGNIQSHYNSIPDTEVKAFQKVVEQMPITFKNHYNKEIKESKIYAVDINGEIREPEDGYTGPTVVKDITTTKTYPYKAISQTSFSSNYQYQHLLNKSSQDIKVFKYLDWYRLGIQVQYKTGKWSDVIYLTDLQNTLPPTTSFENGEERKPNGSLYSDSDNWFAVPVMKVTNKSCYSEVNKEATDEAWEEKWGELDNNGDNSNVEENTNISDVLNTKSFFDGIGVLDYLHSIGAVKVRPVIVYPDYHDRDVICQGIVAPTVYNVNSRYSNSPFTQSSWFTRVNSPVPVEPTQAKGATFEFYVTLYSCFHSDNSGKTTNLLNGTYCLEGKNGDNLEVTIQGLKGQGSLYGESQIQVKCIVYDETEEHLTSWLNTQISEVMKSAQGEKFAASMNPLYSKYLKKATDGYDSDSDKNYYSNLNDKKLVSYRLEDAKSFRLLNNLGVQIHRYFRWVPFFDGTYHTVDTKHCPGNKNNAAKNRVIGEIDNTGKDSYRCDIGRVSKGSIMAYASMPLEVRGSSNSIIGTTVLPFNDSIDNTDYSSVGSYVEFRHNYAIPGTDQLNAEIQSLYKPVPTGTRSSNNITSESWRYYNKEYYYVDQNIVTLHSPELEFDTSVQNLDLSNTKFRIVGMTPIVANQSDISITTSGNTLKKQTNKYEGDTFSYTGATTTLEWSHGLYTKEIQSDMSTVKKNSYNAWKIRNTSISWFDTPFTLKNAFTPLKDSGKTIAEYELGFAIYPWQRNGALNNDIRAKGESSAWLEHKKLSNLRYSNRNAYLPQKYIWYADHLYGTDGNTDVPRNGMAGAQLFNSNEITPIKVSSPDGNGKIVYYGNVDTMATISMVSDISNSGVDGRNRQKGYPIMVTTLNTDAYNNPDASIDEKYRFDLLLPIKDIGYRGDERDPDDSTKYVEDVSSFSSASCRIKYKSTPHAVLSLSYLNDGSQLILPTFGLMYDGRQYPLDYSSSYIEEGKSLWWNECKSIQQDRIPFYNGTPSKDFTAPDSSAIGPQYGWLWLGELYKEVNEESRFGGKSVEAIANNKWQPCGDAISIIDEYGNVKKEIEIVWQEGDTFYQRYDHIKTYPFTLEDQNSVTDIVSFMVETRINIDGRYDRNRGNKSNLVVTPENFNQLNPVYSQSNNMFTYTYRDPNKLDLSKWANNITWSLTKTAGDLIDKWTHITLANTLDLDGKNGKITSLQKYNDQLIAFQEKSVSMIMYNESMQISTTDGVPVELGNSGKVNGYRVLSDTAGCSNKWSIASTENGIFFVDGITKNAYLFSGGKVSNLSDAAGMSSWFNTNASYKEWNPATWDDMVVYYNSLSNDVYFINKYEALAFNLMINTFTSFYSYENTPFISQIEDDALAIHDNHLYRLNTGKYNYFYGKYKPFSTEVIVNSDRTLDKTFTNVDFRSETGNYDDGSKLLKKWIDDLGITFNSITASNEYQSNTENLIFSKYGHSNLKRKFRIWRADVPRDKTIWNRYKQDRMRNTWLHLKLQMNETKNTQYDTARTTLHDLNVTYYI